jgi:hypothetical protein
VLLLEAKFLHPNNNRGACQAEMAFSVRSISSTRAQTMPPFVSHLRHCKYKYGLELPPSQGSILFLRVALAIRVTRIINTNVLHAAARSHRKRTHTGSRLMAYIFICIGGAHTRTRTVSCERLCACDSSKPGRENNFFASRCWKSPPTARAAAPAERKQT